MNPVENKQPSEWAKELADEFFDLMMPEIAKRFDEIRAEIEAPLKSQADGLAVALEFAHKKRTYEGCFRMMCDQMEAALNEIATVSKLALEAYRKGKPA